MKLICRLSAAGCGDDDPFWSPDADASDNAHTPLARAPTTEFDDGPIDDLARCAHERTDALIGTSTPVEPLRAGAGKNDYLAKARKAAARRRLEDLKEAKAQRAKEPKQPKAAEGEGRCAD